VKQSRAPFRLIHCPKLETVAQNWPPTQKYLSYLITQAHFATTPRGRGKQMSAPKLFTELHPIDTSSLPRPGNPEWQKHLDELIAAATEVIESTKQWKSRGTYKHVVEIRERQDWRGERNWYLRRSIHKGIPFEVFKVTLLVANRTGANNDREVYWKIIRFTRKNTSKP
jgi:hypothetical protein